MANNQFLVSVADAIGRDPITGNVIFLGKTNISSALTLTMSKTDVRGGINNPLLYSYYHDRNVAVKVDSATFDKVFLPLNAGASIVNGAVTAVYTENITLNANVGVVSYTPTGNVSVIMPSGAIQVVTPTGTSITVPAGGNQVVSCIYNYTVTADQMVATTTTPPNNVDLILTAQQRDSTGTIQYLVQIEVPKFQISGNYTLNLAANGVSQQSLDGVALTSTNSSGVDFYYTVAWIPVGATISYSSIAATPTVMNFSVGAGLPSNKQVTTLGIRGGVYQNAVITSSASYARTSGCTCFSSASTGVITASSATTISASAQFTVTYWDATSGSLTDIVSVYGVA